MKFYKDNSNNNFYFNKIQFFKLNSIYCFCHNKYCIIFFKNGK
jgi:hypothetical protein